jgi:hypothetical protein
MSPVTGEDRPPRWAACSAHAAGELRIRADPKSISRKLGASDRREAVRAARELRRLG